MQIKERFGLIGQSLRHSYSQSIHNKLGKYEYNLYTLNSSDLEEFVSRKKIKGFNVTIPYKTEIIKYLSEIDEGARKIGAVNTVVREKGKLIGYNTDFDGMKYMLNRANINIKDKVVMILGSGGTSKTATAVAESLGARRIVKVSRAGEINYQNYKAQTDVQVIINTTPVGMFPDNYSAPIDLDGFPLLEGVADVVYNPNLTMLCFEAQKRGIKNTNGLPMLVAQAKYASEKFRSRKSSDDRIDKIIKQMQKEKTNIVLVGMPGSGKSTVGIQLAKALNLEFIDTDSEIVRRTGKKIPEIFELYGEAGFREIETNVIKDVSLKTGRVIATGGGAVTREENLFPLKSNGIIFWVQRDIEKLATNGRPLSKDLITVQKLYFEREKNYKLFSDFIVDNNQSVEMAVKGVIEKL